MSNAANWYRERTAQHFEEPSSLEHVDSLARRAKAGDRGALHELAAELGGIADSLSGKHTRVARFRGLSRDDLQQEAMRAMLESLKRWSGEKAAFRTFAYNVARFAVLDAINTGHLVSVTKQMAIPGKMRDELDPASRTAAINATHPVSSISPFPEVDDLGIDLPTTETDYDDVVARVTLETVLCRSNINPDELRAVKARYRIGGEKRIGELAEEWGISLQAVGARANRGVRKLKIAGKLSMRRLAS